MQAKPSTPPVKGTTKEKAVEFTSLSRSVHIYRPKKEKPGAAAANAKAAKEASAILYPIDTSGGTSPDAILIMGWMNAPLRIVAKYAAPYTKLFPEATIIIKLSVGSAFVASKEAKAKSFREVVKALEEVQTSSDAKYQLHNQVAELQKSGNQAGLRMDVDSQIRLQDEAENKSEDDVPQPQKRQSNGVMIHSFSDGGANNLSELLRLLRGRNVPSTSALIFDCSPGIANARSGSIAFTLPLSHRPYVRLIARLLLYSYFRALYTLKWILGRKSWSEVLRLHLNTSQAWSYTEEKHKSTEKENLPPRMYLYSKADALIDYRAVEEHAEEAARLQSLPGPVEVDDLLRKDSDVSKGVVAVRRWDDAKHCDLGRADFDGYWSAIRSFLSAVL
ncbi:hypothetical protein CBS101457_003735 [Exobasidium rhododendri]|nr:hypothetical protein CBS101457_003735 [Exobasidium rhododendri]